MPDDIQFDILLKGRTSIDDASAENIEDVRPTRESIERCVRWLAKRGLRCHRTDFGLVCEGPPAQLAEVFGSATEPSPPDEIAELIAQVTVSQPPELF